MEFQGYVELAGEIAEGAGVAVIFFGAAIASVTTLVETVRRRVTDPYAVIRRRLGQVILVGLELLVAADIIRTVSHAPTLLDIAVLGGIVLIRTFLSFTLEMEIEGKWPWQPRERESAYRAPPQNT